MGIVASAAKDLDRVKPDWYRGIDFDRLDMRSSDRCILGQTYGHFDRMPDKGLRWWTLLAYAPPNQDKCVGKWRREVNARLVPELQAEIAALRTEIETLRARVEKLTQENARLWRRLMARRHLDDDRETLAQLDRELESKMQELETTCR